MDNIENALEEKINKLLIEYDNNIFENRISDLKNKDIFIYGCGNAGISTYGILKKNDIKIKGFIDRKAEYGMTYDAEKIYKLEEVYNYNNKKKSLIIISFLCDEKELKKISDDLKNNQFFNICYFHDIYNLFVVNHISLENPNYCRENKAEIIKAYNELQDLKSKKVYMGFLKGMLCLDANLFVIQEQNEKQYFPQNIKLKQGYSRFVDCGAFNGDTARELKKENGEVESIVCFEPDINNFTALCSNVQSDRVAKEQILIPCGTHNKNEIIKFLSGFNGCSEISVDGNVCIQGCKIDDIIPDFKPTFIKMDIEGSEYNSLCGAERIISGNLPDLAICVYHRLEDLWRIILLVKQYSSKYNFYMRSHGVHGMETVLYATCN